MESAICIYICVALKDFLRLISSYNHELTELDVKRDVTL